MAEARRCISPSLQYLTIHSSVFRSFLRKSAPARLVSLISGGKSPSFSRPCPGEAPVSNRYLVKLPPPTSLPPKIRIETGLVADVGVAAQPTVDGHLQVTCPGRPSSAGGSGRPHRQCPCPGDRPEWGNRWGRRPSYAAAIRWQMKSEARVAPSSAAMMMHIAAIAFLCVVLLFQGMLGGRDVVDHHRVIRRLELLEIDVFLLGAGLGYVAAGVVRLLPEFRP